MKRFSKLLCFMIVFIAVMAAFCTLSFAATDNTSLLLHFDNAQGANLIVDSSSNVKSVTVNGNVELSNTQSKYGDSSAYFDGSGGYLTISNDPDLNFESEDFIIDMWFMPITDADMTLFEKRAINTGYGACDGIVISRVNNIIQVNISTNGTSWNVATGAVIGNNIETGVWNHIIVSRQGNKIFGVINGVKGDEVGITGAFPSNIYPVKIGNYSQSYNHIDGYIDEFKIIKGISYQQSLVPQNLSATSGNALVNLSWDAVEVATGYNVKRSATPGGPYDTTVASNFTGTTYTDSTLTNGTTYYYVISAVVDGIESPNSNEASATPTAPIPIGNSGILELVMTNGQIKEYDLTATELQDFLIWYDERSAGTGKAYYVFNKKSKIKPFLSRKEYISFDKISSFEINEYAE